MCGPLSTCYRRATTEQATGAHRSSMGARTSVRRDLSPSNLYAMGPVTQVDYLLALQQLGNHVEPLAVVAYLILKVRGAAERIISTYLVVNHGLDGNQAEAIAAIHAPRARRLGGA